MRTRIIGAVLIFVGLGFGAWLAAGTAEAVSQDRSITGHILGFVLFCVPFWAVGLYLLLMSRGEVRSESKADKQRTILNAVMTRGRVSIADLAIECNLTREQVRDHIYDLIGKDLFRGYVNWDKGELVSAEAAHIKSDTCPNCGGKVELAGKGLVRCPYCGTETYLSPPPSASDTVRVRPQAPPPSSGGTPAGGGVAGGAAPAPAPGAAPGGSAAPAAPPSPAAPAGTPAAPARTPAAPAGAPAGEKTDNTLPQGPQ